MYNIGVVSFSGLLSSEQLEKVNRIGYTQLIDQDNLHIIMKKLDCIIISENSNDHAMAHTLKTIMEIKAITNKLIWVITNDQSKIKNIIFLKLGVDGVVANSDFSEEFVLVMKNALNRQQNEVKQQISNCQRLPSFSDKEEDKGKSQTLELLPSNQSILIDGKNEVNLTRLEYRAFEILYKKRNNVVTYAEMYDFVWKADMKDKQYRVANMIFHLRKKIEENFESEITIRTIRSVGYRFNY